MAESYGNPSPKTLVKLDKATAQIWSLMGRRGQFEGRQKWLTDSGWDAAWVFHNWGQLPLQMKVDLAWNLKHKMDKHQQPDGSPLPL